MRSLPPPLPMALFTSVFAASFSAAMSLRMEPVLSKASAISTGASLPMVRLASVFAETVAVGILAIFMIALLSTAVALTR